MLNKIIYVALQQRLVVVALAILLSIIGWQQAAEMPIDLFPDLNRPRVVIMTEAPGMAPEEVESLITFPLETTLHGATGVEAVRSSSSVGISIIYVEFAYGTDIYIDRQIVTERLQVIQDRLPSGITPQLAPISSIMGQILMLAVTSTDAQISPMNLRTSADWVIRQRLLTIPGVAQVFTMGGERKQYHVTVDPSMLRRYDVTLNDVKSALQSSNKNGTGGYLDRQGPEEVLVRSLGRIQSIDEIGKIPVAFRDGVPIPLSQVAQVAAAPQVKRGDSAAFVRSANDHEIWMGGPAVLLTVNKQPGADTRRVTDDILAAVEDIKKTLPAGIEINPIYSQKIFIDRAIDNVSEALRDGAILVVIILFLFLFNLRTTLITLTAIPLSLLSTAIIFAYFGLSINTMTLGGLAVAMGELVDDAIVDVENIFRRLKENRSALVPRSTLEVVYRASVEVRRSIVYGTAIVILAFMPLFALGGMEGKLFAPLAMAYVISILASLVVSLTVTPVMSYWLLGSYSKLEDGDGFVLRGLKTCSHYVIRFSLHFPRSILASVLITVFLAGWMISHRERDFLPPFNEGTIQLNVVLPPGTSLAASNAICETVSASLRRIEDIDSFARRTGRAELDEHAEGVHMTEFIIDMNPTSSRTRAEQLDDIRHAMEEIPGIATAVEQPLSHLISHMLSGVKAQIGIKVYGEDLDQIRLVAERVRGVMATVPGVTDLYIEPQVIIPQLRIEMNDDAMLQYGVTSGSVSEFIETAMNGEVVSQVLEGQRSFDLVIRMDDNYRENVEALRRLSIHQPDGGVVPLSLLANIYESGGPNTVQRENVRRRTIVQCNVAGRGVVDVVEDIQSKMGSLLASLPDGCYLEYGGQFESQQSASKKMGVIFVFSLLGIFVLLYSLFHSVNLALQVMAALPMAFIGAVVALIATDQHLTIAAMVGFISLAGIAARNGILLLQHYAHLVLEEKMECNSEMIIRAGKERLAPVLMTAFTSGIALLPLVMAEGEPGKEILYPVATVIVGGLISSTLLDFLVHPALFWLYGRKSFDDQIRAGDIRTSEVSNGPQPQWACP